MSGSLYQYNILGSYATISESEWHQILELNQDGTAKLTTISYHLGSEDYDEKIIQCLWKYEPPYLKVQFYDNTVEILKYLKDVECSKDSFFAYYQINCKISVLEKTAKSQRTDKIYSKLWKEPLRTKFVKKSYERVDE